MQSKIVKRRYNQGNQDTSVCIPNDFLDHVGDSQFFECVPSKGGLLYRPLNMSGSAEVVETQALPQASHQPCGDDCD